MRMFIIILTLVMTFKPVLPLVDYVVNYDYISEVLCINKDKPELKCNGKCHLKNELAKASEDSSTQDENSQNTLKRVLQAECLCINFYHLSISALSQIQSDPKFNFNQHYSYLYSTSVFHPPLA